MSLPKLHLSEAQVLHSCLKLLSMHPQVAWVMRNNSGALPDKDGRPVRFGMRGSSDIIGQMTDGRLLAVECKSTVGKLTEYQEQFLTQVRKHNGVAIVARSADDVTEGLK